MHYYYYAGNRIYVTDPAGILICKGHTGTVTRWVNGDFYVIRLDGGAEVVLRASEFQNITGREKHV
jgi:hypothetical protein